MTLPFIIPFLMLLLWFGKAMIGLNEVTVEARNDAWHRRDAGRQEDAFRLNVSNFTEGRAERKIEFTQLFDDFAPATSRHSIIAGSWDHSQIDLNSQPSWPLLESIARFGGNDVMGSLQEMIRSKLNEFFEPERLIKQLIDDQIGQIRRWADEIDGRVKDGFINDMRKKIDDEIKGQKGEAKTLTAMVDTALFELGTARKAVTDLMTTITDLEKKLNDPNLSNEVKAALKPMLEQARTDLTKAQETVKAKAEAHRLLNERLVHLNEAIQQAESNR